VSPPCSRNERAAMERIFSWLCALCSREYRMALRVRKYSMACQDQKLIAPQQRTHSRGRSEAAASMFAFACCSPQKSSHATYSSSSHTSGFGGCYFDVMSGRFMAIKSSWPYFAISSSPCTVKRILASGLLARVLSVFREALLCSSGELA
jgi:hypothetical protein